jgi:predicted N-formylglutamate amidohydrolase
VSDAVEIVAARHGRASVVLSCEHASAKLPAPWSWPEADRWLTHTHWAVDIGAAELTRELAEALGAGAALARFTRLLIDPNRPPGSPTLIRKTAEGRAVQLNAQVSALERQRRLRLWQAYHRELSSLAADTSAPVLFAVHSFTPIYEGNPRELALGVLFDEAEAGAVALAHALEPLGETRLNEPYSGRDGLIYSAQRHADDSGKQALEIEVRQDLCADPAFRANLVEVLRHHWA